MPNHSELVIWILSDGRRGHVNQSIALGAALGDHAKTQCHTIKVRGTLQNLISLAKGSYSEGKKLPLPDLIIAAGHKTHWAALSARRCYGGKIILIMRPTLPANLFDLVLLPSHDRRITLGNTILFEGALSRVTPYPHHECKTPQCLIVIGGPSKHHQFDDQDLISAVNIICESSKHSKIIITNSPRTPSFITRKIETLFGDTFAPWVSFEQGAIQATMLKSTEIWVTEDSASMIYDALGTGSPVGIIPVIRKRESRLSKLIDSIFDRKFATPYKHWRETGLLNPSPMLSESKRCASLVVKALFQKTAKPDNNLHREFKKN